MIINHYIIFLSTVKGHVDGHLSLLVVPLINLSGSDQFGVDRGHDKIWKILYIYISLVILLFTVSLTGHLSFYENIKDMVSSQSCHMSSKPTESRETLPSAYLLIDVCSRNHQVKMGENYRPQKWLI